MKHSSSSGHAFFFKGHLGMPAFRTEEQPLYTPFGLLGKGPELRGSHRTGPTPLDPGGRPATRNAHQRARSKASSEGPPNRPQPPQPHPPPPPPPDPRTPTTPTHPHRLTPSN